LLDRERLFSHFAHRASTPHAKQDRHFARGKSGYARPAKRASFSKIIIPSPLSQHLDRRKSEKIAECGRALKAKVRDDETSPPTRETRVLPRLLRGAVRKVSSAREIFALE